MCAAFYTISTDNVSHRPSALAELLVKQWWLLVVIIILIILYYAIWGSTNVKIQVHNENVEKYRTYYVQSPLTFLSKPSAKYYIFAWNRLSSPIAWSYRTKTNDILTQYVHHMGIDVVCTIWLVCRNITGLVWVPDGRTILLPYGYHICSCRPHIPVYTAL